MTDLVEGNLKLSVPASVVASRFDGSAHGLSHCMSAVDFILETSSHYLFVEFKDPDNPDAISHKSSAEFVAEFQSGKIDADLYRKFRDTWLYRNSEKKVRKPIRFLVLVACSSLGTPELSARQSELRKKLPVSGNGGQDWNWFVEDCLVFNLESWNKALPQLQIERVAAV